MAKVYRVLERAFINGRLYEPGETVELEIDGSGSHLQEIPAKAEPKQTKPKAELPDA